MTKTKRQSSLRVYLVGLAICMTVLAASSIIFTLAGYKEVTMGSYKYNVKVAKTEEARQKGVSSKGGMYFDGDKVERIVQRTNGQAVLLVFPERGTHCATMEQKDLYIDAVWLDSDKRAVHIEENVAPANQPNRYCGPASTKYILEILQGEVRASGVKPGDTLGF